MPSKIECLFAVPSALFFQLMHQPLCIGPAGVMCPDSRWLCRLLLPLASQMQLFGLIDFAAASHCDQALVTPAMPSVCTDIYHWTEDSVQAREGKDAGTFSCPAGGGSQDILVFSLDSRMLFWPDLKLRHQLGEGLEGNLYHSKLLQ